MPQGQSIKRPKKKRSIPGKSRAAPISYSQRQKPPLSLSNRQQRPLTAAANKKFRRSKIAGNTISYEDENTRGSRAAQRAIDFGLPPQVRSKLSSSATRRPMTAKNRRTVGKPPISGVNRRMTNVQTSSTPNNRVRNKLSAKRSVIVPQQS